MAGINLAKVMGIFQESFELLAEISCLHVGPEVKLIGSEGSLTDPSDVEKTDDLNQQVSITQ